MITGWANAYLTRVEVLDVGKERGMGGQDAHPTRGKEK
jgi:hypothetical protein